MSTPTIRLTRVPTLCKTFSKVNKPVQLRAMTTFFPRFPSSDFAPLFRFIDDYDVHRAHRRGANVNSPCHTTPVPSFQPRFDVSEEKDGYVLEGELPGIDQENVRIEFTDPHTIIVKGKVERVVQSTSPNDDAVEGSEAQHSIAGTETPKSHHATIDDESEDEQPAVATPATEQPEKAVEKAAEPARPRNKYWVSERAVGEFHRSFQFPARVEQDAVKASMRNGVLRIVVPKAVIKPGRTITIE